ncbi:uncharacterized protein LOC109822783 isoform X2 [Asparagus officinalis]|uniref:uncharacterized protein LOC109822783 isoform X2 n=1 Tax=Asparagus officinalis TaxID=4686 RepID=UPI00098E3071|nr:uncharacterized protein LOC109822783 isoform X2 [Asparagus officinalis]
MKGKTKEYDSYSTSLLSEDSDSCDNPEFSSSKCSRNWDKDRDFERCDGYSSPPNISATANGSVEIKNQEQVVVDGEKHADSAAICRICFEHDGDQLIAPCACKGTSQFVHRSCLDNWRSVKEGYAFSHCMTCKAQYHLHINFLEGSCWRTAKFRMFVARDIIIVFLAVQMIISMLGGLTYLCDMHGKLIKLIDHGWGHPVFFYYCCGAILTLALLGIVGLIAQCSPRRETGSYNSSPSGSGETPVYCLNGPIHWNLLWYLRGIHCSPKDLAEALSYSNEESAYKGICGRGPAW